ncbi:hypothetical protein Tco_1498115 [Tanacetum coccineum]
MWETRSYKTHEDHKNLYEALEKSMDRDHSNQLQANLAEARKKRRKRSDSPRTPYGSPPLPPPPPPPSPGASGALRASGASRSSQLPPPPPSSSSKHADSDKSKQQTNDSGASDSIKPHVTTHQSSAWTISDTRNKPSGSAVHHLSPPDDQQLNDDSVPADEEHSSATPEPAWVIPTSHIPDAVNNWANALAFTYQAPAENSLLEKTGDIKGSRQALSISKMKAAYYPEFGLELLVPEHMWSNDGHLNHLPSSDKCMLSTAVNLWTRNLVIRQQVEDLQLGIESYQKQLNLTKPG